MAEMTWEKTPNTTTSIDKLKRKPAERWKFLIGGLLILTSVAFLIMQGTVSGARFFIMVDEVVGDPAYVGETVRLTGAVIGDTIEYDASTGNLSFTVANMPDEYDDLAQVLREAANNTNVTRLQVFQENTTMPDLLQHEAQAILTGKMGEDGVFYATELNLKCPTRFEEHTPDMLNSSMG
jgi:cytochrome c-type biogenesis protein CcmE